MPASSVRLFSDSLNEFSAFSSASRIEERALSRADFCVNAADLLSNLRLSARALSCFSFSSCDAVSAEIFCLQFVVASSAFLILLSEKGIFSSSSALRFAFFSSAAI